MLAGPMRETTAKCARLISGGLLLLLLALPARAVAQDKEIAEKARLFGSLPQLVVPDLSPDGAYVAAIEPVDGRRALVVRPRAAPQDARVRFAPKTGSLTWFGWEDSDTLLVELSFAGYRGTHTVETRLFAVGRARGEPVELLAPRRSRRVPQNGSLLVSLLPQEPGQVLMGWDGDLDGTNSLYRVDLASGRGQELERGTAGTVRWLADRTGEVRLRIDAVGVNKEIWVRARKDAPWRLLVRYDMLKGPLLDPRFFSPEDPDRLYVLSEHETGRQAAYLLDARSGAMSEALFSHPTVDIDGIIQSRKDERAIGYLATVDLPTIHYIDPAWTARQQAIDAELKGTTNVFVSESEDSRYQLVIAIAAREPGRYYIRDDATGALTLLGARYPALASRALGDVVPFPYRARDGLDIPAYVTLPAGLSLADARGAKWPVVVLPHGGPNARVTQTFDFLAQFMASLGYIVLQPNYRGSTGYGRAFYVRGHREWGRAMQDDVTDGVRRLIAEGIADPGRICIVGASYGGYAALMGAVRTPDLYLCAASIEGVTDLKRFLSDMRNYKFHEIRVPRIVDPGLIDNIAGVSPVEQAAQIKVPVLLVHGDQDAIVPLSHSTDMAKALRRARKPVELVVLKGGDHQLSTARVRTEALERLGMFLRRALGPGAPAPTAEPRA
jgi:dipeptidyl aminopeptidase/acylaminoacyl peptidase